MEIKIKIPINSNIIKKTIKLNEEDFMNDLFEFIDQLENDHYLNNELKVKLENYGINKFEFKKMIEDIKTYSTYDERPDEINFPFEPWIERLLTVYEEI